VLWILQGTFSFIQLRCPLLCLESAWIRSPILSYRSCLQSCNQTLGCFISISTKFTEFQGINWDCNVDADIWTRQNVPFTLLQMFVTRHFWYMVHNTVHTIVNIFQFQISSLFFHTNERRLSMSWIIQRRRRCRIDEVKKSAHWLLLPVRVTDTPAACDISSGTGYSKLEPL